MRVFQCVVHCAFCARCRKQHYVYHVFALEGTKSVYCAFALGDTEKHYVLNYVTEQKALRVLYCLCSTLAVHGVPKERGAHNKIDHMEHFDS